jgi:hypothetical protein
MPESTLRNRKLIRNVLSSIAHRCKQHKLPYNLTSVYVSSLIPDICPVLGIPLKRDHKGCTPASPSIDRIVPELGYVRGNIIIVSQLANQIRNCASPSQIIQVGLFYQHLFDNFESVTARLKTICPITKKRQARTNQRETSTELWHRVKGTVEELYNPSVISSTLQMVKKRAHVKQVPFNLTSHYVAAITKTHCPVLGIPLIRGSKHVWANSPTLDRIIPEHGYIPGNVIVVSHLANSVRSNATPTQILRVGYFYQSLLHAK